MRALSRILVTLCEECGIRIAVTGAFCWVCEQDESEVD